MLIEPMLASPITLPEAERFVGSPAWRTLEQKLDGHRILAVRLPDAVSLRNRKGDPYLKSVPQKIQDDLAALPPDTILDGELVGDTYWVFDVLKFGVDVRGNRQFERSILLTRILDTWGPEHVKRAPLHRPGSKSAMLRLIENYRGAGAEGVILRFSHGTYECGIRSKALLKLKFVNTVDCVVLEVGKDGKEALRLALYNSDGEPYEVGACSTIGKDIKGVEVGSVVEVRYLYVGSNGRLYQPHYERKRDDKDPWECDNTQLHHVNKKVIAL